MVSGIKTLLAHARFKDPVEREQREEEDKFPEGREAKK